MQTRQSLRGSQQFEGFPHNASKTPNTAPQAYQQRPLRDLRHMAPCVERVLQGTQSSLNSLQSFFLEWRTGPVDDGEFIAEALAEVGTQKEEDAATEESTQAEWVREGTKATMKFRRLCAPGNALQALPQHIVGKGFFDQGCPRITSTGFLVMRSHACGQSVQSEKKRLCPPGPWCFGMSWKSEERQHFQYRPSKRRHSTKVSDYATGAWRNDSGRAAHGDTDCASAQSEQLFRQASTEEPPSTDVEAKEGGSRHSQNCQEHPTAFSSTHNGKNICSEFQVPHGCSRGDTYKFMHVCAHCRALHSFAQCNQLTK